MEPPTKKTKKDLYQVGRYPCHFYIKVNETNIKDEESDSLWSDIQSWTSKTIVLLNDKLSEIKSDVLIDKFISEDVTNWHISLSFLFYLQKDMIDVFLNDMRTVRFPSSKLCLKMNVKPTLFVNEDKTKVFLVVCFDDDFKTFERFVSSSDSVLSKFGCKTSNGILKTPHISIACANITTKGDDPSLDSLLEQLDIDNTPPFDIKNVDFIFNNGCLKLGSLIRKISF